MGTHRVGSGAWGGKYWGLPSAILADPSHGVRHYPATPQLHRVCKDVNIAEAL